MDMRIGRWHDSSEADGSDDMNLSTIKSLIIPEGSVKRILCGGKVLWKKIMLPDGYKAIEYIGTSDTQYIDTGFIPNQDTRFVCEFMYLSGTEIYGCRTATTTKNFSMRYASSSYQVSYRNGYFSVPGSSSTRTWYIADQDRNVFSLKSADGLELGRLEFAYADFKCSLPIAIGAIITGSDSANCASGRFKSCQIYDNGILVRDFIPCINPDGEAGMWDKVENKFYGNAGSGTFITSE